MPRRENDARRRRAFSERLSWMKCAAARELPGGELVEAHMVEAKEKAVAKRKGEASGSAASAPPAEGERYRDPHRSVGDILALSSSVVEMRIIGRFEYPLMRGWYLATRNPFGFRAAESDWL